MIVATGTNTHSKRSTPTGPMTYPGSARFAGHKGGIHSGHSGHSSQLKKIYAAGLASSNHRDDYQLEPGGRYHSYWRFNKQLQFWPTTAVTTYLTAREAHTVGLLSADPRDQ